MLVVLQHLMVLDPHQHLLGLCQLLKQAKDHVSMTGTVPDCVYCFEHVA